jgi:DeoR family fructose operon transcriptional repressor
MLDVSDATVRRDLEWLEKDGIIERTHGGAILSQRLNREQEYNKRAQRHPKEKRAIGALAADGTIITNNLIASLDIGKVGFELILLGGTFHSKSLSIAGRYAIENLSQVYADKAFIGVDGISPKHGCTVPSNAEAEVVRLMVERTQGPINIVTDHSKWGVVSNFEITPINLIHRLITDGGLDASARASLAAHSFDILIAEKHADTA